MVATDRVSDIFADARAVHADALRLLESGDIRDAAEKAWCATKRATDGLILARTARNLNYPRTLLEDCSCWPEKTATSAHWWGAITPGRAFCTVPASTWASVNPRPRFIGAFVRLPTISATPRGWPAILTLPNQRGAIEEELPL